MKPSVILMAITFLSGSGVYAQSNSNESKPISSEEVELKKSTFNKKSFDVSVGYANNTLKDSDNDKIDGSGIALSAGKIFNLNNNFSTTTSLIGSYISLDERDFDIENADVKTYDIGLSQRLSYSIETNGVVIKPFIEGGFSRGRYNLATSLDSEVLSGNFEVDMDYNKLSGAIGAQLVLEGNFTPFIKYSLSKVKFDKEAEVTTNFNGVSNTETVALDSSDDREIDSSTLIIGAGFIF